MEVLAYLLTIAAGVLNPVQSAMNGAVNKALGRPLLTVMISVVVSFAFILLVSIASGRLGWPAGKAQQVPWWAWFGGVCGAVLVLSQPVAALKLGAGTFVGITVTAATLTSVLLDHFGWLGFQQHTAGPGRIAGALLMVAGMILVRVF